MRRVLIISFVLVAVFVAGAVAWASIPDASGVIHACRKNTGGDLRVIDTGAGQSCAGNETALNWTQAGPAGTYTNSVQGTSTGAGTTTGTITCNSGDIASGIGWNFPVLNARLKEIKPTASNTWAWAVDHDSAQSWDIWVQCLDTTL